MEALSSALTSDPTSVAAICGLVVALGLLKRSSDKRSAEDIHRLRTPSGAHWLWGHERAAWETPDSGWYAKNLAELGLVVRVKGALLFPDAIAVADPGAINHMYSKHVYSYTKSPVIRPLVERIIGHGLLYVEGDEHKKQRAAVAPAFTHVRVKSMQEDVYHSAKRLLDKLHAVVAATPGSDQRGVRLTDVPKWLSFAALDIIGKVAFAHDFQLGETPEARAIQDSWHTHATINMSPAGFFAPLILRALPWITSLPLPAIKAQGEIRSLIRGLSLGYLQEKQQAIEAGEEVGTDLLGTLAKINIATKGQELSILLDQAVTFVIAGQETTAGTMSMTILELARNPKIQDALRAEIRHFEGSGPDGLPSYDELQSNSLPLLDAVCKEGLRFWPSVSYSERVALKDDVIPLRFGVATQSGEVIHSLRVSKGQVLLIPALVINRNKQMWGPDGDKFDPSRWIEPGRLPPSTNTTSGINGHFSFSEGPRICVGHRLAIFEVKTILFTLIKHFEFRTTDDTIQTAASTSLEPYVVDEREKGPQLPLYVRTLDV